MKGFRTWSVEMTEDNGQTPISTTYFARKRDANKYADFQMRKNPDKEIWLNTLQPSSPDYQKLVLIYRELVWKPPF